MPATGSDVDAGVKGVAATGCAEELLRAAGTGDDTGVTGFAVGCVDDLPTDTCTGDGTGGTDFTAAGWALEPLAGEAAAASGVTGLTGAGAGSNEGGTTT